MEEINWQNIPRSLVEVKQGVVPKLDNFMFFDYSNIELRILGYYLATTLGDWSVADEFNNGEDLHNNTAMNVWKLDPGMVSQEARQRAKTLNFSIIYGGGAPTLMRQGVAADYLEAKALLKAFHATRPGIALLVRKIVDRLDEVGYIQTPWGSRLHPMDDHKALNVLIQGCAADLMRHAIREVSAYTRLYGLKSHIVNVVHDDLMFDCVRAENVRLAVNIPKLMDYEPISKIVQIKTSTEISYTNWASKEEYVL